VGCRARRRPAAGGVKQAAKTHAGPIITAGSLAVLVALAAVLFAGCGSSSISGGSDGATAAADFSGVTLDGAAVSLSEYRGRPLVLAFMASW
jgi:hypothetical protein